MTGCCWSITAWTAKCGAPRLISIRRRTGLRPAPRFTICISSPARCGRFSRRQLRSHGRAAAAVPARADRGAPRNARTDARTHLGAKPRTIASTKFLCRSAADLAMLMTDTPQGRYPYAGIPWYSTTFGRDGLITALQMLWWSPGSGARRVAPLGGLSGQDDRSARRCPARKNPARNARRRDGGAARSAVRPLLRQRRFDAAVRPARRALCWNAPATSTPSSNCGRPSRQRWPGSTGRAIPTATALSNISAPANKASPIRAGRIPTTRSSMPTDAWPRARSRSSRCRAMSTPPSAWRRVARGGSGSTAVAQKLDAEASRLAERFEAAFWCPDIDTYALALDGAKEAVPRCARRMPGRCCSPALPPPIVPGASPRSCCSRASSPAGASAPWPKTRRALIRCRITTARSGRTTMR